jgi:hypothetical protein
MYTSILMFALSGLVPAAEVRETTTWLTDYNAARKQVASAKKPLAVVLSPGAKAWGKLSSDGGLSDEAQKFLKDNYLCVFINTETEEGKRLAKEFEMPSGLGIVISDRTGDLQAFRHEGDLANSDLLRYLQRYADPNYVVVRTESNPHHRGGMYGGGGGYVSMQGCCGYPSGGFCSSCSGHGRHRSSGFCSSCSGRGHGRCRR